MTSNTRAPLGENALFEDLSGTRSSISSNPYNDLIDQCMGDNCQIQARYNVHRFERNERQKYRLQASGLERLSPDPVLQKLVCPALHPGYTDPRHCLVFWARPPLALQQLIGIIQEKISGITPNIWLMPPDCLHMTVLEITHSKTKTDIEGLIPRLATKTKEICDYTFKHRARLVKPMLNYDDSAVALSFVPATAKDDIYKSGVITDDSYTYHHLRRDIYHLIKESGINVASRYNVPSAHLTIARFVGQDDFCQAGDHGALDMTKMTLWIQKLEGVNAWLSENYWPESSKGKAAGGEWIVGDEKGLELRKGPLWYGGGETVCLGRGF